MITKMRDAIVLAFARLLKAEHLIRYRTPKEKSDCEKVGSLLIKGELSKAKFFLSGMVNRYGKTAEIDALIMLYETISGEVFRG